MVDVLVIGAGIGGLTSASLLARRGLDVLVLERRDVPGGCCSAHVEAGYRFDIASSLFYGFGRAGFNANRRVLDELDIDIPGVHHDPCFHILLGQRDGTLAQLPVPQRLQAWRALLGARFPTLRAGIARFYEELAQLHAHILQVGFLPLGDAQLFDLARLAFGRPSMLTTYVPLLKKTVWDILAPMLEGGDPDEIKAYKHLLDVDLAFSSCTPSHELPLLHAAPILMDRHAGGVFYPRGGASAISEALVDGLRKHGGAIRYNQEVARIRTRRGRVLGVTLASGEEIDAEVIICNAGIWDLYTKLLGEADAPARQVRAVERLAPTSAAFVVCVSVDAELVPPGFHNHTIVIPAAPGRLEDVTILYAPSVDDPALAPPGRHAITLVHLSDYARWVPPGERRAVDNPALDRAEAALALQRAEAALPGIASRGEIVACYSPARFERQLGRRFGAVGGPAHTLKQSLNNRSGNKTPVEGLYLVGDSTYPGEGVVAVTISGLTCADQIQPVAMPRALGASLR